MEIPSWADVHMTGEPHACCIFVTLPVSIWQNLRIRTEPAHGPGKPGRSSLLCIPGTYSGIYLAGLFWYVCCFEVHIETIFENHRTPIPVPGGYPDIGWTALYWKWIPEQTAVKSIAFCHFDPFVPLWINSGGNLSVESHRRMKISHIRSK